MPRERSSFGLAAPWFGAAAAVVAVDQLVKALVLSAFQPGEGVAVTGFFNLVLVFNKGAAFSFLADQGGWQRFALAGFAVVASVVVAVLLVRSPGRRLLCAGLALILGGAVGNVIDRLRLGHVVDFLDFHALGWHWPAFNVADAAITVGAALVILEGFRHAETPGAAGESAGGRVRK
ncbi:MAG TPA: signal peptidase II [Burkholderiales bacterium]|nr:signal peptidase II [Burkholderiales bacterium]